MCVVAHVEHFKAPDFSRLTNELAREKRADGSYRFNRTGMIDEARTPLNYSLGGSNEPEDMRVALLDRLMKVKHSKRRDLNVVSDWVFTCPEELRSDPVEVRRYFEVCRSVVADRYGIENVLPGSVHMDETSPHMHQPVIPVKDGRVSAKALFTRGELKQFHRVLDKALEVEFGVKGLALNGRTKGNYTVAELKERTRVEVELTDREERLLQGELSLKRREKAVEAREKAVEAREAVLTGEYTRQWETALRGLREAQKAAEAARDSIVDYGRKNGWKESKFAEPSGRRIARVQRQAEAARRAKPKGGSAVAALKAAEMLEKEQSDGYQLGG